MKSIIISFFLFSYSAFCSAVDADVYIDNMLKQYAKLTEYKDDGVSIHIKTKPKGEISHGKLTFKTKYEKNGDFEFSWVNHPDDFEKDLGIKPSNNSFWKNNNGIYTKYWHAKEATSHSDFTSAISSAAGVSDGLAFFVPRFLTANESCLPNLGSKTAEVVGINATTVSIKLVIPNVYDIFITIDTNTYLLKGYELHSVRSDGTKSRQIIKLQHVKSQ